MLPRLCGAHKHAFEWEQRRARSESYTQGVAQEHGVRFQRTTIHLYIFIEGQRWKLNSQAEMLNVMEMQTNNGAVTRTKLSR